MAHYVISDPHGELERFHALLEKIQLGPADTLYILGDVLDRGPQPLALLREIMAAPNYRFLLGNHEYMCCDYFSPAATELEIRRWNKNGNEPTLAAFALLSDSEKTSILNYLHSRPTHLELTVGERRFYLVHGFPGDNVHDEVWGRPTPESPNPRPGCTLILGHTPVSYLGRETEEMARYLAELEAKGQHLEIYHAPGFIDIDCGCGYSSNARALACLRLEDMAEFYA